MALHPEDMDERAKEKFFEKVGAGHVARWLWFLLWKMKSHSS